MKFLFADKSLGRCDMLKAVLESNGVPCMIKNEFMPFSTAGIGIFGTEPIYPELWVVDDDQYDEALALLAESEVQQPADDCRPEE